MDLIVHHHGGSEIARAEATDYFKVKQAVCGPLSRGYSQSPQNA